MAWRAGCRVANMEFNQFHPTCLYHPNAKSFLISEAVRGEGGLLKRPDGSRFMKEYDARAELAPRDIVARAIDHEMKRLGADCLYLDISHKPADFVRSHFPTIYERLPQLRHRHHEKAHSHSTGCPLHLRRHCGERLRANRHTGIIRRGRVQLYRPARCQPTGQQFHCWNAWFPPAAVPRKSLTPSTSTLNRRNFPIGIRARSSTPTKMSSFPITGRNYAGLCGITSVLSEPQNDCKEPCTEFQLLQFEIHEFYSNFKISNDLIELRNLALVSELIIRCAMERKESRGLHFTLDYPTTASETEDTILTPSNYLSR